MTKRIVKTAISFIILMLLNPVIADSQSPVRGMSMAEVIQQQGEPKSRKGPIGEPPVSKWVYKDFSVYFEGNTVIHSVKNNKRTIY